MVGNRMRAVLLGDHVDGPEEKLKLNGFYEITDAPVVASGTLWKSTRTELNYQLHLSNQVRVRDLSAAAMFRYTNYKSIAEIKEDGLGPMDVAVLGVVLYVGDEVETITTGSGRISTVREIVITDSTCEEPLFISIMNELATNGCPAITPSGPKFAVVGFTGMLTSSYKGFSLTKSMVTTVNQFPIGDIPDTMRKWVVDNALLLTMRRNKHLAWLGIPTVRSYESVSNLRKKMAPTTQTGDRFWIKVVIPYVEMNKINTYVGCCNCEGPTTMCIGTNYRCDYCLEQFCQARMCLTLKCVVADESGKIPMIISTPHIEALFRMPVHDIVRMISCGDMFRFQQVKDRLQETPVYIRAAATIVESHYPCPAWSVVEVELLNIVTSENDTSCSYTIPKLPDAVVTSINGFSDVYNAYVDSSSPWSLMN